MVVVELGKKVYAYYDLLLALEVDPSNKKVKQKLDQVGESLHIKTQRESVRAGLGIGLKSLKRKSVKGLTDGVFNEENQVSEDVVKADIGVDIRSHECK